MDQLNKSYQIPSNVFYREVSGEAVVLNLDNEGYFGLDDVGVDMWKALTESADGQAAFAQLLDEYDVDPTLLESDLKSFIDGLLSRGLLTSS